MPSRPCTPEAGALTASAEAPVDGHGHQFGQGVDQSDYASPPAVRFVGRAALTRFGDPKGDILRVSFAIGFTRWPAFQSEPRPEEGFALEWTIPVELTRRRCEQRGAGLTHRSSGPADHRIRVFHTRTRRGPIRAVSTAWIQTISEGFQYGPGSVSASASGTSVATPIPHTKATVASPVAVDPEPVGTV